MIIQLIRSYPYTCSFIYLLYTFSPSKYLHSIAFDCVCDYPVGCTKSQKIVEKAFHTYGLPQVYVKLSNMESRIPILIIGMGSCWLPGWANGPEKLGTSLQKVEVAGPKSLLFAITEVILSFPLRSKGSSQLKTGYFLAQDVTAFDAPFLQYSSLGSSCHESAASDPTGGYLRGSWEFLYSVTELRGSVTSVYAGIYARDHNRMSYKHLP